KYLLAFVILFLWPMGTLASTEFETKIDVRYRYDKEGVPAVEQRVSLTNKVSTRYATEYTMEVKGELPKNLKAWDNKGALKISILDNKIVMPFNDEVAGIGKTLNFWMTYEGTQALHNGQTWEVLIPKLDYPEEVDSYRIILEVPKNFGRLAFVNPNLSHIADNIYTFAAPNIKKSGLVAIFGDFQTLGFNLKYRLDKPGEIALPPDTSYQRVIYTKIDPKPRNISVDSDGNWLAEYDSAVEVSVSGQANVLSSPAQIVPSPSFEQLKALTNPTKLWPQKSLDLKTPRKIYDYVIEKSNTPVEFTNLFVSLARTAGVPARAIVGFGGDILHEWPQYWDWNRAMWISFDPSNLSLMILGTDYQFPLHTDVNVKIIDYTEFPEVPLETQIEMPKIIYAPLGATVYLTATNPNPFAIYHTMLLGFEQKEIISLPPYAKVRLELPIKPNFGLNLKPQKLNLRVGELTLEYNIDNRKYLLWHGTLAILTSSALILLGFVAHQAWSVYLQGRPRHYHIRRES
ncbi:MAG: transglutaminase-like domain-containing protein, partial [Patescibacteria group bacterium]